MPTRQRKLGVPINYMVNILTMCVSVGISVQSRDTITSLRKLF